MGIKIKTLYEHFQEASKEQINEAIQSLSEKEREVIMDRYGNDLENPKAAVAWTKEKNDYFYGTVYPRLKRILNVKTKPKNKKDKEVPSTIYEVLNQYSKKEIDEAFSKLEQFEKFVIQKRYGEDFNIPKVSPFMTKLEKMCFKKAINELICHINSKEEVNISSIFSEHLKEYTVLQITEMMKELSQEDILFLREPQNEKFKNMNSEQKHEYIQRLIYKMLEILEKNNKKTNVEPIKEEENETMYHKQMLHNYLTNPTFLNELRKLSCEKITIISLKYGLATDKKFSVEEISEILNLPVEYVIEVLREFLNNYKTKIISAIDNAIDIVIYEKSDNQKSR